MILPADWMTPSETNVHQINAYINMININT